MCVETNKRLFIIIYYLLTQLSNPKQELQPSLGLSYLIIANGWHVQNVEYL